MHPPRIKIFAEAGILRPEAWEIAQGAPLGSVLLQYRPWGGDVSPNWLCYIDTVKFNTSLSGQKEMQNPSSLRSDVPLAMFTFFFACR